MKNKKQAPKWAVLTIKLAVFAAVIAFVSFSARSFQEKKEAELAARARGQEESAKSPSDDGDGGFRTYQGKQYKLDPLKRVILCIGVDTSGEVQEHKVSGSGGQADVIALLIQDKATDEIEILSIPRDTMTEIKLFDLVGNELGSEVQHLNLAYGYGNGGKESCELLTEAVENLLGGISIDGYMSVTMGAIAQLNDMAGGVMVTIDEPGMSERDPSLVYGETVTLQGKQAEIYVRYRDTDVSQSALGRMDRHKEYAEKWIAQASEKQRQDSQFLGNVFQGIQEYMVTDLNKDEYLDAGLAVMNTQDLFSGDHFFTVPGEGMEGIVYDEFYPDEEALEEMIIELFYKEI